MPIEHFILEDFYEEFVEGRFAMFLTKDLCGVMETIHSMLPQLELTRHLPNEYAIAIYGISDHQLSDEDILIEFHEKHPHLPPYKPPTEKVKQYLLTGSRMAEYLCVQTSGSDKLWFIEGDSWLECWDIFENMGMRFLDVIMYKFDDMASIVQWLQDQRIVDWDLTRNHPLAHDNCRIILNLDE